MPLKKIIFKPGVNRENTRYTTEGGWYDCDKVRFRQGTPEKIGGWQQISVSTFLGICRAMWNWITLSGLNILAVGTNLKYYLEVGGAYNDITPIRYSTASATVNNPFDTINASPIVTVNDVGSNVQTGDYVNISNVLAPVNGIPIVQLNIQHEVTRINNDSYTITVITAATSTGSGVGGSINFVYYYYNVSLTNAYTTTNASPTVNVLATAHGAITGDFVTLTPTVTFNGVTIFGNYQITVVDVNNFTIQASTSASSSGSNTGITFAEFEINTGPEIQVPLLGWGAGGWGSGLWGFGGSSAIELRTWSQQNFGEDLIFNPRGGAIYYWSATDGVATRGIDINTFVDASDCPTIALSVGVSDASRFVFAYGCNDYGESALDPMLIRWSDQESFLMWTPDATNQAGSIRLSHGSEIYSAWQVRQELVVFTDSTIYSLQYLGPPVVWGSQILGDNISIISPSAVALASGVLFWMGRDKFYKYDGAVATLTCDLKQYVFSDINLTQRYQIFSGTNEGFNEIWWFYCSSDSTTVNRYVTYNYLENLWFFGTMERSYWLDSGLRTFPLAATYSNNVVFQEYGVDDNETTTTMPIEAYIQSSEFDIDDGHNFGFVWRMLPDVTFRNSTINNPSVTMTLYPLQNSGAGYNNPTSQGGDSFATVTRTSTVQIEQFTGTIFVRVRGRQMAFKIEGNQIGQQWQLGAPRIDIRTDGRRGNS